LNKILNELKASSDEKLDTLIKTYDQLWLLVIDEISLIGNRMLNFIDCRSHVIKQVHNQFMGGLDVIMTNDFYQAPPIWNSCIFKPKKNGFNILITKFWHENVKCHELHQIMWQKNTPKKIPNRFQTTLQMIENVNFIENTTYNKYNFTTFVLHKWKNIHT
jgi:hypothetical protein